jgi:hypothetical protein
MEQVAVSLPEPGELAPATAGVGRGEDESAVARINSGGDGGTSSGVVTRISGARSTRAPFSTQGLRAITLSIRAVTIIAERSRRALAIVEGPGCPARSSAARQARTPAGVRSARFTSPSRGQDQPAKRIVVQLACLGAPAPPCPASIRRRRHATVSCRPWDQPSARGLCRPRLTPPSGPPRPSSRTSGGRLEYPVVASHPRLVTTPTATGGCSRSCVSLGESVPWPPDPCRVLIRAVSARL